MLQLNEQIKTNAMRKQALIKDADKIKD